MYFPLSALKNADGSIFEISCISSQMLYESNLRVTYLEVASPSRPLASRLAAQGRQLMFPHVAATSLNRL